MHYDMRPDRLGWTLFHVTTGRPVVWEDRPLTALDLETAQELIVLLHQRCRPTKTHGLGREEPDR